MKVLLPMSKRADRGTKSTVPVPTHRTGLRPVHLIAAFILLGLYTATESYLILRHQPGTPPWWRIALLQLPQMVGWSLVAPLLLACAKRYPFDRSGWGHALRVHLAVMAGIALILILVALPVTFVQIALTRSVALAWTRLQHFSVYDVYAVVVKVPPTYAIVVLLDWLWAYHRRFREKEVQASELKAQLAQAQLQSLKMQLNPHFMFNALNSIATLQRVDLPAAQRTLERLAGLLRRSLSDAKVQKVTLQYETAFLRDYLDLEQIRFSNRLKVVWELEPDCLTALVPHLILQPLVENAVKHGFWPTNAPGTIWIRAWQEGADLLLRVEDDGMGARRLPSDFEQKGIGIPNTRDRLAQLYGQAASLSATPREGGGFAATLLLPLEVGQEAAPPSQEA